MGHSQDALRPLEVRGLDNPFHRTHHESTFPPEVCPCVRTSGWKQHWSGRGREKPRSAENTTCTRACFKLCVRQGHPPGICTYLCMAHGETQGTYHRRDLGALACESQEEGKDPSDRSQLCPERDGTAHPAAVLNFSIRGQRNSPSHSFRLIKPGPPRMLSLWMNSRSGAEGF